VFVQLPKSGVPTQGKGGQGRGHPEIFWPRIAPDFTNKSVTGDTLQY